MKNFRIIFSLLAAVLLMGGCGPEKSTLDIDRDIEEQKEQQKTSENQQVAGRYLGNAFYKDQPVLDLDLEIRALDSIGGTGQAAPALRGFLKTNFSSSYTGNTDSNVSFDVIFSLIDYDGRGNLVMEGVPSTVPTAGERATINLKLEGNRLNGWYYPPRPLDVKGERVFYFKVQLEKQ